MGGKESGQPRNDHNITIQKLIKYRVFDFLFVIISLRALDHLSLNKPKSELFLVNSGFTILELDGIHT